MKTRIKQLRESLGLTQEQFGERISLSRNFMWMLETGAREPSERTIRDICQVFAVNEEWLRTGEGEMKQSPSREQEMSSLIRQLMADRPESFRSALITTLLRFDPDGPEWVLLENIYKKVSAEIKGDKE